MIDLLFLLQQLHLYSANSAALILNYGKLPAQRCLPLGKPTFRQFRVPKTDQFAGNSPRADHAAKRGPEFVALILVCSAGKSLIHCCNSEGGVETKCQ